MESLPTELSLPPANAQESARNNIIRELVETERKYVQDLEIMQVSQSIWWSALCILSSIQKYANALAQNSVIDQDTIHLLFPGLNKLLNFQRKFLIRFESTAELPWNEQRWGQLFLDNVSADTLYLNKTLDYFAYDLTCFVVRSGTIGRRVCGLWTLLRQLHKCIRAYACKCSSAFCECWMLHWWACFHPPWVRTFAPGGSP